MLTNTEALSTITAAITEERERVEAMAAAEGVSALARVHKFASVVQEIADLRAAARAEGYAAGQNAERELLAAAYEESLTEARAEAETAKVEVERLKTLSAKNVPGSP